MPGSHVSSATVSEIDSGSGANETFENVCARSNELLASICIDDLLDWHTADLQEYANQGYKI